MAAQARPSLPVVENMDAPSIGPEISRYSKALKLLPTVVTFKASSPDWRGASRKQALSCPARAVGGGLLSRPARCRTTVLYAQGHHQGSAGGGAQSWPRPPSVPHPNSLQLQQVCRVEPERRRRSSEELSSPAIPPLSAGSQSYKPRPTRTRVFGLPPTWPASVCGPLCRHF